FHLLFLSLPSLTSYFDPFFRHPSLVCSTVPLPQQCALLKIVEFFIGEHKLSCSVLLPEPNCVICRAHGEATHPLPERLMGNSRRIRRLGNDRDFVVSVGELVCAQYVFSNQYGVDLAGRLHPVVENRHDYAIEQNETAVDLWRHVANPVLMPFLKC